jgi:hypothetical protein
MVILSSSQADSIGMQNWKGNVLTPFHKENPLGDVWISGGGNKVWQRYKSYVVSALCNIRSDVARGTLCLSEACFVPARGLIAVATTLLKRTPIDIILETSPEPR